MYRRAGFTIIEVAIAVVITAIIAAMVVPRYNAAVVRQEFLGEAQQVANCLQEAQALAAAPNPAFFIKDANDIPLTPRYISAKVDFVDGGVWTCELFAHSSAMTALVYQPADNLPNLLAAQPVHGGQLLGGERDFRVYFGVLERGVPVQIAFGDATPALTAPLGSGVGYVTILDTPRSEDITANLELSASGAPIRIVTP